MITVNGLTHLYHNYYASTYKLCRNQIVLCVEVGLCKDLIYHSTTLQPHGASINSYEKDANFNPNTTKSYKNYLQNTQHMVLRNRPTLIIGTERLACLNSPPGVQLGTLAYHAAGPGFEPRVRRARCACFFSPPSLPCSFRTFPTNPAKVLGLL